MTSREDRRRELEDELAALEAEDDDSDQVTVTRRGGDSFTGSWRRALKVAESWGVDLVPKAAPEGKGKPKSGDGDGDTVRRFSGRRIS